MPVYVILRHDREPDELALYRYYTAPTIAEKAAQQLRDSLQAMRVEVVQLHRTGDVCIGETAHQTTGE